MSYPTPRGDAAHAVYAFYRTVDDRADLGGEGGTDRADQRRALERWRRDVALCYEPGGRPADPIASRLAEAVRAVAVPRDALLAVIACLEMGLVQGRDENRVEL